MGSKLVVLALLLSSHLSHSATAEGCFVDPVPPFRQAFIKTYPPLSADESLWLARLFTAENLEIFENWGITRDAIATTMANLPTFRRFDFYGSADFVLEGYKSGVKEKDSPRLRNEMFFQALSQVGYHQKTFELLVRFGPLQRVELNGEIAYMTSALYEAYSQLPPNKRADFLGRIISSFHPDLARQVEIMSGWGFRTPRSEHEARVTQDLQSALPLRLILSQQAILSSINP